MCECVPISFSLLVVKGWCFILPFGCKGVAGCECVIFVCASFILPFGSKGVGGCEQGCVSLKPWCECVIFVCTSFILSFGCNGVGGWVGVSVLYLCVPLSFSLLVMQRCGWV